MALRTAGEIGAAGGSAVPYQVDLTDTDATVTAAQTVGADR
ncbi:MAG: hypothetical protein ACFCVK_10350 [Acidimicrobiales bacterium]